MLTYDKSMQSKNPIISVIITTKNSAKTLKTLLESINNQTYKKVEIVVVDNKSTDKTIAIARKYTKKVYNIGPERSAQRNYGAKKALGKYVVFLDSDMELTPNVIYECVEKSKIFKALILPEKTVGSGFVPAIRSFEREMYEGDSNIELARFYEKKVFLEIGGYDENLTGPEDYDLSYRVSKKYKIGRIYSYVLHHEEDIKWVKLLQKKFYYANKGAIYAQKHPELIKIQGTIFFRKVYLKHWKKFLLNPILGMSFLLTRILETIFAIAGYISAVGVVEFFKKLFLMFSNAGKTMN